MITLKPSKVGGSIWIPASKSQTIRALLIALAARGRSIVRNPLYSADTLSCIEALRTLGCRLCINDDSIEVDSGTLQCSGRDITIDTGNSGTTTYLLYGLLGTLGCSSVTLKGDEQLNRRPIGPLVEAYRDLGLEGGCTQGRPPVVITGALEGGSTSIECPTSQYLSSLLLSLPLARGDSEVDIPLLYEKPYVSMTLDWLDRQGIAYDMRDDLQHLRMKGGQHYHPFDERISGDFSSASFFLVAAAITGCTLTLKGLDMDDSQGDKGVIDILVAMGCSVECTEEGITVTGGRPLHGGTFDLNSMPDALPALSVLGAVTDGPLTLTNVANARIKETDRIACMTRNLRLLGLEVDEMEDGLTVHPGPIDGGVTVPGYGDHRMIMAMAVLSLIARNGLTIDDEKAADVTFPTFFSLLERVKGGSE